MPKADPKVAARRQALASLRQIWEQQFPVPEGMRDGFVVVDKPSPAISMMESAAKKFETIISGDQNHNARLDWIKKLQASMLDHGARANLPIKRPHHWEKIVLAREKLKRTL